MHLVHCNCGAQMLCQKEKFASTEESVEKKVMSHEKHINTDGKKRVFVGNEIDAVPQHIFDGVKRQKK